MSARGSLRAVRDGKAQGFPVTCEVAPHHFVLTDEALESPIQFDTNCKMNPPLREQADVDAMIEGIVDGSVDVIATDHAPHHADEKRQSSSTARRSASSGSRRACRWCSIGSCTPATSRWRAPSSCCR